MSQIIKKCASIIYEEIISSIDWTQCTDASSGLPYFWNIATKDVTWEMPTEYQHFLDHAISQNANSLKKWILCYTDDNAPYYFNEVTREISWEKPDDFTESTNNHRTTGDSSVGSFFLNYACKS